PATDPRDGLPEPLQAGKIGAGPAPGDEPDPVACLRRRARALLGACATAGAGGHLVAIGDRELTVHVAAAAGAIEVAAHGWDISVACGISQPVPPGLAAELLPLAPLLIPRATRAGLFADPVPLPEPACPGDRLIPSLGRRPRPDSSACPQAAPACSAAPIESAFLLPIRRGVLCRPSRGDSGNSGWSTSISRQTTGGRNSSTPGE